MPPYDGSTFGERWEQRVRELDKMERRVGCLSWVATTVLIGLAVVALALVIIGVAGVVFA